MLIGYARVSTTDQTLSLQRQLLTDAGCTLIFEEKISGAIRQRPELDKMLQHMRVGDVVVVTKLDRLARSTHNLLDIVEILKTHKVELKSLGEPWADTTTHAGKMIMTIFAGIAEFERDLIRERTSAGRQAAMKNGVKFGRPGALSAEQKELGRKLIEQGETVTKIASIFSVNRRTIYRLLNSGR